jgi:hypothetical protein
MTSKSGTCDAASSVGDWSDPRINFVFVITQTHIIFCVLSQKVVISIAPLSIR